MTQVTVVHAGNGTGHYIPFFYVTVAYILYRNFLFALKTLFLIKIKLATNVRVWSAGMGDSIG